MSLKTSFQEEEELLDIKTPLFSAGTFTKISHSEFAFNYIFMCNGPWDILTQITYIIDVVCVFIVNLEHISHFF